MQPTYPARDRDEKRRAQTTEYVVAEWLQTEYIVGEPEVHDDEMDWNEFWAKYAANLDY